MKTKKTAILIIAIAAVLSACLHSFSVGRLPAASPLWAHWPASMQSRKKQISPMS